MGIGDTVGIVVLRESMHAVLVRRATVVARATMARSDSTPMAPTIEKLLDRLPPSAWPRPRVVLALGPHELRVREIEGLPPSRNRTLVVRGVIQQRSRVMLAASSRDAMGVVGAAESERPLALAIDDALLKELTAACNKSCRLTVVVPTIVVRWLAKGRPDGTVEIDGSLRVELSATDGCIETIHVARADPSSDVLSTQAVDSPDPEDAKQGCDLAIGATAALRTSATDLPLLRIEQTVATWRIPVAALTALAAAALLFFAPVLAQRAHSATRLTSEQTRGILAEHQSLMADISSLSNRLRVIEAFGADATSPTAELATLTRALPPELAVINYRRDTSETVVTLVGVRAGAIITALNATAGIERAELQGPVTRERLGDADVERVTVALRLSSRITTSSDDPTSNPKPLASARARK